jgi:GT2 family glycosyltransferase
MIAIAIINYSTAAITCACIAALEDAGDPVTIYLLDNGSGEIDVSTLRDLAGRMPRLKLFESERNLGFAGGMNRLLEAILAEPENETVLLLNSDTKPTPGFLSSMLAHLDPVQRMDMVGARQLRPEDGSIESLGITLYRSTLASNRKHSSEILLGPTGGCALFTRRLLEDMKAAYGEWFDEAFFCYAEDTDFVIRARWLGYRPALAEEALVYHIGSLSAGGAESDFVLYHGIRNSLWWLAKDAPAGWFLRSLPWFLALHGGIWLRHLRRGRIKVLWRLYRDALAGLPSMLRKRSRIRMARRVAASEFSNWVEPRFYERGYLKRAWFELWRGRFNQ